MILKTAILSMILIIVSCGQKHPSKKVITQSAQLTPSEFDNTYLVDGVNTLGRVFYIHYYNGNAELMNLEYFGEIKRGMIAKGYQVVSLNCPKVDRNSFIDGGTTYLNNFLKYIDWVVADTNEKLGTASEMIIGGVSFGGLHTIIAMGHRDYFDRYFTVVSVVDVTVLKPYANQKIDIFNGNAVASKLNGKNGLMVWGGVDDFVDFRINKALQKILSVSVVGVEVPNYWHDVGQPHLDAIMNWL